MVYLRTVEDGGAVDSAISASSTGACDSSVVWAGDEGLRWAWDEELCPPWVLAMVPN